VARLGTVWRGKANENKRVVSLTGIAFFIIPTKRAAMTLQFIITVSIIIRKEFT